MAESPESRVSDVELVRQALEMPGEMGPQYSYFYTYSVGNMAYLWMQGAREIAGKYRDWPKVGRHVIAGRKAYEIIRPTFRTVLNEAGEEEEVFTGFVGSRCIFTLGQTEGEQLPPIQTPRWELIGALGRFGISQVEFDSLDGNLQGYSRGLEFAISPIAANRLKTTFHEIGHIILGHTVTPPPDAQLMHRGQREGEAEITALLCMHHLGLLDDETASHGRAYVQHWTNWGDFPETSARRVLKAANAIIRAGRVAVEAEAEPPDISAH